MDRLENIEFCIRYLMRQNGVEAEVPTTLEGKQRLLRALMNVTEVESRANVFATPKYSNDTEGNVWQPQPLSEEFLRAQDAELQAQLQDRGVVEIENSKSKIEIWQGDITRLRVDAIVNAANSVGLGCWHPLHACIDNAIHSAAGLQLRQECHRLLAGCEIATGDAIITSAYNLPCRYVIHTVGPIIPDGVPTRKQEEQLADCYRNCLGLAESNGCCSIAFCCISTGEFHFPNRRAAEIAVDTVKNHEFKDNHFSVVFNVFKDIDYDIYRELLSKN